MCLHQRHGPFQYENMDSIRRILAGMDSITLGEMGDYALMNRVDTKYVFNVNQLADALESISNDYRVLSIADSSLLAYETLYYDTPEHFHYLQHHNGRVNRSKYRMRRYVETDLCFLEVKKKNNKGRTKKQRIAIEQIEHALSESSQEYLRTTADVDCQMLPQLWCEFSRITLVGKAIKERVTLDLNLAFRHDGSQNEFSDIVITEVKQSKVDRSSPFREAMKDQGIREMRISKYCLGCTTLKPHLKRNRFKPRLKAVQKIAGR